MRSRLVLLSLIALALVLASGGPAFAAGDGGEGLAGETNDKMITFFSLGVVLFFPLLALILTLIQSKLEKRKEEKKAAALRQRIGW